MEKGIKEGKSKLLIKQLKAKFKTLPKDYEQKILEAEDETIENSRGYIEEGLSLLFLVSEHHAAQTNYSA